MKKLGITGGVGSGKSLVLAYLEKEYRAAVYQADLIAHQVQLPGEECYRKVTAYFGEQILQQNGAIDRQKLGNIVFSDEKKLKALNEIVHPSVNQRIRELIEEEENKGTELFVLEAALLTEKIYREMLDEIWYIHVDEPVRRKRLKESRGYSDEKISAMLASQPAEAVFRNACGRIIENSGEFDETKRQITLEISNI